MVEKYYRINAFPEDAVLTDEQVIRRKVGKILNTPGYNLIFTRDEDGSFVANIKEFRGCISCGGTIQEAYDNLMEAAELWLEAAIEYGMDIPGPEGV
jgi:predicted RNase H-like HicB family nuclease